MIPTNIIPFPVIKRPEPLHVPIHEASSLPFSDAELDEFRFIFSDDRRAKRDFSTHPFVPPKGYVPQAPAAAQAFATAEALCSPATRAKITLMLDDLATINRRLDNIALMLTRGKP